MELNITKFFSEAAPADYSASAMELGQDVGKITWQHACEDAPDFNLLDTEDKCQTFRDYCKGFGAWDDDERAAWTAVDCNALLMQMIAGDIRDVCADEPGSATWWREYETGANAGRYSGSMYRGDNGDVYYYVGS